jgi:hypothetical protein
MENSLKAAVTPTGCFAHGKEPIASIPFAISHGISMIQTALRPDPGNMTVGHFDAKLFGLFHGRH